MKRLAIGMSILVAACAAPSSEDAETGDDAITGANRPHVLALGDSIAFGWDPTLERDSHRVVASNYRGYAEMVAESLGADVDNASCPGETSSHFVRADGEDNGCADNRAAYKLHVDWQGAPAQLDFVVSYLAREKPELITLSIGGNDLLRIQEDCKLPTNLLSKACQLARLPFFEHGYGENLENVIRAIYRAGYRGKMVLLTTYAPDYSDGLANFGLNRFNGEIRESVDHVRSEVPGLDLRVADGFAAFKARADAFGGKTCATGLLVPNGDGTCDIHPTKEGHTVLAGAILDAIR